MRERDHGEGGERGKGGETGREAMVLARGSLPPARAREQHPAPGKGAVAAVPSAPTIDLNVVVDVSVPVRKKTGCCERSGLPCPHRLATPAAVSVPSLLTSPRALVSSTQPHSPHALPIETGSSGVGEHGSGPPHVALGGWWPCPRLPGAADLAMQRDSAGPSHRPTSSI